MDGCKGEGTPVNSFALVSYLPEPLGGFLDRLRTDLIRECHARAHLTVLPPRPLVCPPEEAWQQLQAALQDFQPFRVELGDVQIFPITQVVYLSIGAGRGQLESMNRKLNAGSLGFRDPFPYHPHVTVAQDMEPAQAIAAAEVASQRWRELAHPRDFVVDRLTFVQNTLENRWTDLAGCALDYSNISI
jgi:2'-5' RNA ligase